MSRTVRAANYELRSRVFALDDTESIYKMYKLYRRKEYCLDYGLDPPVGYYPELHDNEFEFLQAFYPSEWLECEKIYRADRARHLRLKYKIRAMLLLGRCYFIRFSFTDDVLASTKEQTRRKYVARWLHDLDCACIGNIDFGELRGREHYHAIVARRPTKEQLLDWILNYGTIHSKPVRASLASSVRLSKYVSKLCNHAVKVSCRRGALLYSRRHKLPSTLTEFKSFVDNLGDVAPILAKGYVLGITNTQNSSSKLRPEFRPIRQNTTPLVARCCMCGSVIPVPSSDIPKHTLVIERNGRPKKLHFCSDCIKEYKVKINCEV